MKNFSIAIVIIILICILENRCSIYKQSISSKINNSDSLHFIGSHSVPDTSYSYLFFKDVNINYILNGDQKDFNCSIKLIKDTLLAVSIRSLLGIEVIRIFVKEDSIYIIDRANKCYEVNTFTSLKTGFSEYLGVRDFQDIILGKICQAFDNKEFILLEKGDFYSKFGMMKDMEYRNIKEKVEVNYVVNNESKRIKEFLISSNMNYFHLVYNNYKICEGFVFPGQIEIESHTRYDKYYISLTVRDLKKVDFVSSKIPIPNGYKRKN